MPTTPHAHPEFEFMAELPPPVHPGRRAVKQDRKSVSYTLAVCKALHRENLHHTLYNVLLSIAQAQVRRGFATVSGIAADTGVTTRAIHIYLSQSAEYFDTPDKDRRRIGVPIEVRLSAESIALLRKIQNHIKRYVHASMA